MSGLEVIIAPVKKRSHLSNGPQRLTPRLPGFVLIVNGATFDERSTFVAPSLTKKIKDKGLMDLGEKYGGQTVLPSHPLLFLTKSRERQPIQERQTSGDKSSCQILKFSLLRQEMTSWIVLQGAIQSQLRPMKWWTSNRSSEETPTVSSSTKQC